MKEGEDETWGRVADAWSRWDEVLFRSRAPVTDRMLRGVAVGERVLDIASGTGEPAIDAAAIVGPTGSVLGTDIAEPMLEVARDKARRRGLTNISFERVDGERIDVGRGIFDVVTCRFGLMFMPDPGACLRGCRLALRQGGRVVMAVWAGPERNPWAEAPIDACRRKLGIAPLQVGETGMFAMADRALLSESFENAGFRDVEIVEQPIAWGPFASAEEAVVFVSEVVGPATAMLGEMPAQQSAEVGAELRAAFSGLRTARGVDLPGVALIVTGLA